MEADALSAPAIAETLDLLTMRKIDETKSMSIIQEIVKTLGYELEHLEPDHEISFTMSFTASKLWLLIRDSFIGMSLREMMLAVGISLGVSPSDPRSTLMIMEELRRCSHNISGKTSFSLFLKLKLTLCLMSLGAFPDDLSVLVRLYDLKDLLGYLPSSMYNSP